MLKLILVRHGETNENIDKRIQGQSRGTLSELGRSQIQLLAKHFRNEKIDLIFSSDLERAAETTRAIAQYQTCSVTYLKELRECSFGIFEGYLNSEYKEASLSSEGKPKNFRPQGGESLSDLYERTIPVLKSILELQTPITVLVSTHRGPINCMICNLIKKPIEDFWSIKQDNTCVNTFLIENETIISSVLNCTEHLTL